MTFEELNSLVVAVRAREILYDFFAQTLEIVVIPEYGVKDEAEGKTFKLKFKDCIYFGGISTGKLAVEEGIEFIAWGKSNNLVGEKLLSNMYTFNGSSHVSMSDSDYVYYFENVFGDVLQIISKSVVVTEMAEK